MKLWLISQDKNSGYDTYDSAVVAAENEAEARVIHPGGYANADFKTTWCLPKYVAVVLLGEAVPNTPAGPIVASYNAG